MELRERLEKELEIALRENIISLPANNSQPTQPDFFLEKFEVSKNKTRTGLEKAFKLNRIILNRYSGEFGSVVPKLFVILKIEPKIFHN